MKIASQTRVPTEWHDHEKLIIVPAGEPVSIVTLDEINVTTDRRDIEEGIEGYRKQRRTFVPIQIRGWFALMEKTDLTEPTELAKKQAKQKSLFERQSNYDPAA